jgi:hypothetical protein
MTRATSLGSLAKPVGHRRPTNPPNVRPPLGHPIPNLGTGRPCQADDVDPDLFFPNTTWIGPDEWRMGRALATQIATAKALCSACPVRIECGAWAIQQREQGIWGGLTDPERAAIRRRPGQRERTARFRQRTRST